MQGYAENVELVSWGGFTFFKNDKGIQNNQKHL